MLHHESHILLFDGVCNLCIGVVNFTIKRDSKRKFKFAALQSESGQALLEQFNLSTIDLNSFIFIYDDRCFVKSSAVLHVLKELGGVWKLFYAFIIIPAPIRDCLYAFVAKTRYKIFGKRDTCMVPTAEIKKRFLN